MAGQACGEPAGPLKGSPSAYRLGPARTADASCAVPSGAAVGSISQTPTATTYNTTPGGRVKPVKFREPIAADEAFEQLNPVRGVIDFGEGKPAHSSASLRRSFMPSCPKQ